MVKKFKDIVKQNPEPAKGKSGTDPMDPWGAKAGIAEASEEQLLKQYLKSKGINPDYVPLDTKIAHSKSGEFLKWRRDHEFTEGIEILEATDKEDVLSFDIPLFIRILELAREDVKEDMELHRITERLLSIRKKGVMTMDDYEFIAGIKKLKEEIEAMAEGRMKDIATNAAETKRLNKMTTLQKFRADSAAREKKHADIEKNQSKSGEGMTSAIDRLEKHLNKEEVVNEMDTYPHPESKEGKKLMKSWKRGAKKYPTDLNVPSKRPTAKQTIDNLLPKINKTFKKNVKENTLDPQAATEAPKSPGEGVTEAQKQRSKSARMIKNLYKKKNMKEETYDWEKDDKAQSYGKKPKIKEPSGESNMDQKKPEARIVMSGGTTLTGEKRDEVQIDPLMKKPSAGSQTVFDKPNKK